MQDTAHRWALVLAAGDGRRLSTLSADSTGRAVPKQYCTIGGGPSLLQSAIRRGQAIAGDGRVSVIVAANHRHWWWHALRALPANNVVVQPRNRGTANGILLQLLHLEQLDPQAEVVLLPSDHLVIDEDILATAVGRAFAQLRATPDHIVLLGMTPVTPDPELGYLLPAPPDERGFSRVLRFVEKPNPATAALLIERGGLLNTFILVARCSTLLGLFARLQPDVLRDMRAAMDCGEHRQDALEALYERLPHVDFSHQVLESLPDPALLVEAVADCGWSDLGTPERVGQAISMLVHSGRPPAQAGGSSDSAIDLSARYLQTLLTAARASHAPT
ncbi:MAG TPA: sugar phosphate nucleotidyltransferase [Steroidobacteraceae bacterium]|nr:sugar phosphate nucleotidyltransferase [Steroidobacteraceae bacterium]